MATVPSQQQQNGSARPQPPAQSSLPDILDPHTADSIPVRHVCCIGAGYVGGPTASVIALQNPSIRVTVVDRDQSRIDAWSGRHLPIHEPGLVDVVRIARDGAPGHRAGELKETTNGQASPGADSNGVTIALPEGEDEPARQPNLFFTTACTETIADAEIVLISVNTPTKTRGVGAGRATDMAAFEGAVRDVAVHARPGTILVEKSTVPCKTGQLIREILESHRPGVSFPILSNPEFLSEGTAIRDLMRPDRVIIGNESNAAGHRAAAALGNLYAAWVPRHKIAPINIWSSELCKLTANAMLAQRISSINSISAICERTGANVSEIAKSVGMDPRIGPQFLKAGLGFGGSCFRKDIASLTYLAESLGLPQVANYWNSVLTMNEFQRERFARQVIAALNNSLRGKKIAILGYAFKKDTGDARESLALDVIRILLEEGPRSIAIFDPLCSETDIKAELSVLETPRHPVAKPAGPVEILADPYTTCRDAHAVLALTDWDMFKFSPNLPRHDTLAAAAAGRGEPALSASSTKVVPGPNPIAATSYTTFNPQPPCPSPCADCQRSQVRRRKSSLSGRIDPGAALDWGALAKTVREPRLVFDGKGFLDVAGLEGLGWRVEGLGRASAFVGSGGGGGGVGSWSGDGW